MKRLDRYIIGQFLINFAVLWAVLSCLFVLVDLIVDLDEFVEAGREHAGQMGGALPATLWTIWDYYGPVLILLYVFFSGLLVVAAMGFTFSSMGRAGELVAVATGGIGMSRLAAPIVVVGCVLNAATLPIHELVIPRLAHKLARSKSQVSYDSVKSFPVHYAVDNNDHLLAAARYDPDPDNPMLTGVTILQRGDGGRVLRRITAEQAFWDPAQRGWELIDGYAVSVDPSAGDDVFSQSDTSGARPIAFFETSVSPGVMLARRAAIYPMLLSFPELRRLAIDIAPDDGPIRQVMHSRFSLLILNVLVLTVGLPFFLTPAPADTFRQGLKAAGVCLAAWGTGVGLMHAGVVQANPALAAWLPVVILLPISALVLQMNQN